MSEEEFAFLIGATHSWDEDYIHDIGLDCYAEGWIDDFGIITPKGHHDMKAYRESRHKKHHV